MLSSQKSEKCSKQFDPEGENKGGLELLGIRHDNTNCNKFCVRAFYRTHEILLNVYMKPSTPEFH